jgi:ubiquinone/menaquinone biosynthesis C-methylase UbiE
METKIIGKEKVKQFYQNFRVAEDYDRTRSGNVFGKIRSLMETKAITNLTELDGKRVLDLAMGTGRITKSLLKFNAQVFGVDASTEMLAVAKKNIKSKRLTIIKSNAFKLPFKNNYFDVIVCFRFIRHLNTNERKNIYAEIRRVLKKDGHLIFDACNILRHRNHETRSVYDKVYTLNELKTELKNNKFDLMDVIGYFYGNEVLLRLNNKYCNKIVMKLDKLLQIPFLYHIASMWVVKCKKL